jgi:hypothetical protein
MDFVHYFEGGADASQPRAFVAGSDVLGEMTRAAAESIVAATSAWPQSAGASTTVIESLSGAVCDVDPDDTAFSWRRQAACIQWYAETPSSATVDTANQWLARVHEVVQANSAGGYLNYLEPDTPARAPFCRKSGAAQYHPAEVRPRRIDVLGYGLLKMGVRATR